MLDELQEVVELEAMLLDAEDEEMSLIDHSTISQEDIEKISQVAY